jgi:hypothetical protein
MPKEVFNWRLLFATVSACMAGSLFGFDTGNIGYVPLPILCMAETSSNCLSYRGIIVLPSFKKTFGLNVDGPNAYQSPTLSANIVTTLQAGAILGSLLAYTVADRFGRRPALLGGSVLFLIGCSLQLIAHLSQSLCSLVIVISCLTVYRHTICWQSHIRHCYWTLLCHCTYVRVRERAKSDSWLTCYDLQSHSAHFVVSRILDQR